MINWKQAAQEKLQKQIKEETHFDEEFGSLNWDSNDQPVPLGTLKDANMLPPPGQAEAIEISAEKFLANYRKNYTGPSDEERFEARAALGPGHEIINVITGHKWRT
jgi:hypothetical protein